jgi:Ferredoxin
MKTVLYYFTGTGNSLDYAKKLADKLEDTEIIPIIEALKMDTLPEADRIGIVFPVYIWGLPLIVSRFIKKLSRRNKGVYIFAIATNGGAVSGALILAKKRIRAKGLKLSAGFSVNLPSNFVSMHQTSPEEQQHLFVAADIKLDEIVSKIKSERTYIVEKGTLIERVLKTGVVYRIFSFIIPKMDKDFWTNQNCNGCGLCSKVCPVRNIRIEQGAPKWLHHCEQCYACLNLCPHQALQYRKMTEDKKRYQNPYISLKDLMHSE